jgi:hypothetical protein
MRELRSAYIVLVGKPEGSRPVGKPARRQEDNIKLDLKTEGATVRIGFIWLSIRTCKGLL